MTIRLLAVGDPAVYAYTDPANAVIERFREEHGIEVLFDIYDWDRYYPRLAQAAEADESEYDVVMVAGHLWLAAFADRGWIRSLEEFDVFAAASWDADDILPGVDAELRYRGSRYLVPSFSDGHILYSNTEIEPLLDPVTGFADVLRFQEVAARLHDTISDPSKAPLVVKAAPSEIFLDWLPYLRAFGADFVDPDGEPLFLNNAGYESLAYYIDLKRRLSPEHAPYGNEEVAAAIRDGEVGFGVSWGGQAGVIVPEGGSSRERLQYATLTAPWNVTWSFGLLSGSSHPDEAARLMAWLTNAENDRIVGLRAGSPARRSSYRDETLRRACPWFAAQEALLERAVPLPPLVDLAERMTPMYTMVAAAFSGEISPEAALQRAASELPRS